MQKELVSVVFPPKDAPSPPPWLGWSLEQWSLRRESWYDKIHAILDVERVLQKQVLADDRAREAEATVLRAQVAKNVDQKVSARVVAVRAMLALTPLRAKVTEELYCQVDIANQLLYVLGL